MNVLALHSIGLDARSFDALRDALGDGCRLTAVNLCGHGSRAEQPASTLERYVDQAGIDLATLDAEPVHLLGHSMGGAVAAMLAARMAIEQPGRIASLTLVSSPAQGLPAFGKRGAAVRADGVQAAVAPTMARWFGDAAASLDLAPQTYARSTLSSMSTEALAGAWEALAEFPGYDDIADMLPSTLCVAARDDLSTPPSAMQPIVDAFVRTDRRGAVALVTLDAGGHMAPLFATSGLVHALHKHWQAQAHPTTSI